ncbi:DUF4259 domain-containing protein [Streptomyces sp. NPDC050392]|uniref:DUF4259 domain-containing protein n=1 Tax=Streptomyces sp. NPDC050392 TaxID=3155782 RepID=UPI00342F330A
MITPTPPARPGRRFSNKLRPLAVDALDQAVSDLSELAELWAQAPDGSKWRQHIARLRDVLALPIPPQDETLFAI